MTKRSMTSWRKQQQEVYSKGWQDGTTRLWNDALMVGVAVPGTTHRARLVILRGREAIAGDVGFTVNTEGEPRG